MLGQLFIVAAPSGGGKTSLVNRLVKELDNIKVSISHTTRDKRQGEVEGEHYFFVKESAFLEMVSQGKFVEHAKVFGHYYGTGAESIEKNLQQGVDVLLDIDWQGAQQIKQHFKEATSVFILPPSLPALEARLRERGREDAGLIQERMATAKEEIRHFNEFDYLILNEDFQEALDALKVIVQAARLKLSVQLAHHGDLLREMTAG